MAIILVVVSILVITVAVWLANRFLPIKICPICAGVSLTWFWMLLGILTERLAVAGFQLPIAILMGGSIVGIAYQLEKKLPPGRSPLLWKASFIPVGFAAVFEVLNFHWGILTAIGVLISFIVLLFFWFGGKDHALSNKTVEKLEKEMEQCC